MSGFSLYWAAVGRLYRVTVPGRVLLGIVLAAGACIIGFDVLVAPLKVVQPPLLIVWFYSNLILAYALIVMTIHNTFRGWKW